MRLGYVGPFGDSNFGDYAMLVNNLYDIGEKEIVLFTYNKNLFFNISKAYLQDYHVSICEVMSKEIFEKPQLSNKYEIEYNHYPDIPLEILSEIDNLDEVKLFIEKIDKLVVVGGGYFNHLWNAKHRRTKLVSILAPILLASQLGKKIIFLGNTYGPFDESKELFSNIFNYLKNTVIASRDDLYSPANLRKLGYSETIYNIPDDLYFLNNRLKKTSAKKENYILLELFCSIEELEENKHELIDFIHKIHSTYNLDVYVLPFDKGYGGEFQTNKLKEFTNEIKVFNVSEDGFQKIENVLELVQNAKFILCNRYHLLVLALANNVPVKQVMKSVCGDKRYYYSKSNGMLRKVFSNQIYDEKLFLDVSLNNSLKDIILNLNDICIKQKLLYNDKKKKSESKLLSERTKYIKKFILDD